VERWRETAAVKEKTQALFAAGCLIGVVLVVFGITLFLLFTRGR